MSSEVKAQAGGTTPCEHEGASRGVRQVVMAPGRVVDGIATPALQPAELGDEPAGIQQVHGP
jgi:hypothetical protein